MERNRGDVELCRTLVSCAFQDFEIPEFFQDLEGCYSKIIRCMRAAMRQVNAIHPPTTDPTPDVSD